MIKKPIKENVLPRKKKVASRTQPLTDLEIIKSLLKEYKTAWKKLARI